MLSSSKFYKLKKLLRLVKKKEKEHTLILSGITDVKKDSKEISNDLMMITSIN